ncbi:MAG: BCCT family transporter [Eggerthellaceae bacterium]
MSVAESTPNNSKRHQQSASRTAVGRDNPPKFKHPKKATAVFKISLVVALIFVGVCAVLPEQFQGVTKSISSFISENFGWYYLLLVATIVFLCLVLMLSPVGRIRLGSSRSQPEYSRLSWVAMLFSAGMGIGLVFWGAAEPLSNYALSSPEAPLMSEQALADSFRYSFFHWGISAWAVYGIVGLALAYFMFRKREKPLLSITLKPLMPKQSERGFGKFVDIMSVFATIAGVSTSLGLGAMQINGGLSYLFGIPNNATIQLIIIAITTVCFIASAVSGLSKGLRYLSNLNVILACGLIAACMVVGPTTQIMNVFVTATGDYLQNFIQMSFNIAPYDADQNAWIQSWTVFYWAWWIAWSPFVSMFIARISRGRTVREFLFFVILIPSVFSTFWFATFGTMSTSVQAAGTDLTGLATETVLFGTFANYPAGAVLSIVALVLIFSFFITSADSATFVLGMITEDGHPSPKKSTKIIWGILESVFAAVLLVAGGLNALQNVLIITAFPFSIIMIMISIALIKELHHERKMMGLYVRPMRLPNEDEPFKSYEQQDYHPRFTLNDLTGVWAASNLTEDIPLDEAVTQLTTDSGGQNENDGDEAEEADIPL